MLPSVPLSYTRVIVPLVVVTRTLIWYGPPDTPPSVTVPM